MKCLKCDSFIIHLVEDGCISEEFDPDNVEQYLICGDCGNTAQRLMSSERDMRFYTHADIYFKYHYFGETL